MRTLKVTASFSVDPDLLKQVDDLADAQSLSRSQLLEKWMKQAVEQEKQAAAVLSNPVLLEGFAKAFSAPGILKEMAKALGDELSDEQLELFHRTLSATVEQQQQPRPKLRTAGKLYQKRDKKRGGK